MKIKESLTFSAGLAWRSPSASLCASHRNETWKESPSFSAGLSAQQLTFTFFGMRVYQQLEVPARANNCAHNLIVAAIATRIQATYRPFSFTIPHNTSHRPHRNQIPVVQPTGPASLSIIVPNLLNSADCKSTSHKSKWIGTTIILHSHVSAQMLLFDRNLGWLHHCM